MPVFQNLTEGLENAGRRCELEHDIHRARFLKQQARQLLQVHCHLRITQVWYELRVRQRRSVNMFVVNTSAMAPTMAPALPSRFSSSSTYKLTLSKLFLH